MRLWGAVATACALFWTVSAPAAPLDVYGQLPTLDDFTISPDGKHIAYATNVNGQRAVLINSVDDGKVTGGISVGDQKLRDITWADNDHVLLTMSVTHSARWVSGPRQEYMMTQSYQLSTQKSVALLKHGVEAMNVVLGPPQVCRMGGKTVVYATGITFNNSKAIVTLLDADIDTGKSEPVEYGGELVDGWVLDGNCAIVARTLYDNDHHNWILQVTDRVGYKTVANFSSEVETPYVDGITPDGTGLLVTIPDNGKFVEKVFYVAAQKWVDAPDIPASGVAIHDPLTNRVIGFAGMTEHAEYGFLGKADQDAWSGLIRAFPGENVDLVSWSDDRKRVVVRVDGKRDGSSFFFIDLTTHQASFLGSVYKGIEPSDIAEVRLIHYKAADGTDIPAYLTLPIGKDPKNLPLVVLPHGGPAARDMPEFDWLSQGIASRGYAVLQPEFRGSDGFGWDLLSAGFGQWGRKMQTDLSDGVRYLAQQGIADPRRTCIVGASYGGYAAMAGATLDKGVYRCAVADAGLSDLKSFLRWKQDQTGSSDNRSMRFWNRYMGSDAADDPKLAEISPINFVSGISIPLLLIHGKDDTVVPIEQSEAMADAMKRAGKPVTFIKLDGEDHWLSRPETRLQMLSATVAFLEANNPPN